MLVLIGESGAGKTTSEIELAKLGFNRCRSCTSREKMPRDRDSDYYFLSRELMESKHNNGEFAELVTYNGNYYGILKSECSDDKVVTVEVEGLKQLRSKPELDLYVVYVTASDTERIKRMRERGDSIEAIEKRLETDKRVFKGVGDLCDRVLYTDGLGVDEMAIKIKEWYMKR